MNYKGTLRRMLLADLAMTKAMRKVDEDAWLGAVG
jgi:hypothetical protein